MKACRKCNTMKPMDEFYKHPCMADGRLHTCKECHKSDVKRNYANKREIKHQYDAERYQTPERKAAAHAYSQRHRERYPEKSNARQRVRYAKSTGKLTRKPCEVCGRDDEMVEAHHYDYSAPLDVHWMCFACHRAEHGHIVTAEDWRILRAVKRGPQEPT